MTIAAAPIAVDPVAAAAGPSAPQPPVPPPGAAAYPVAVYYRLTLTGTPDLTTDRQFPMSSFQARRVSGAESFLSVILPDIEQYADAINMRLNGELFIEQVTVFSDAGETKKEIIRVNLEEVRTDQGSTSRSTTMTGHKQTTNTSPKSIDVHSPFYRNVSGRVLYRAKLDPDVNPLDTVTINGETIVADRIRYQVDRSNELMELVEA